MFRQPAQLLRLAGVLACALSAVFCLAGHLILSNPSAPTTVAEVLLLPHVPLPVLVALEIACALVIAALLWRTTRAEVIEAPERYSVLLLGAQVALAFVSSEKLSYVVAAEVGLVLPQRLGLAWISAQASLQVVSVLLFPEQLNWLLPATVTSVGRPVGLGLLALASAIYHFLAYSLGLLGAVESSHRRELAAANEELTRVNAELLATQQMESEAARLAERVSIARELHDALGHHLAALSVNLQWATKLDGTAQTKAVEDAHLLARLLLSDVRHVVTDLRELDPANLRQALTTMAASIRRPQVHLDIDPDLDGLGPLPGHTLFRCVQEALTNAVRHSGADHLWVRLFRDAGGYVLTAEDDGHGVGTLQFGNGLTGMRERVTELGGTLACETSPGAGFALRVALPEKAAVLA